jgi:hypothetical protein
MRALLLFCLSGCNFLTSDLEDQAPVRKVTGPGSASKFGTGVVGLPPGTCGSDTGGSLVVGGQEPDGPKLYLVTFGDAGSSSRKTLNPFTPTLFTTDDVVEALRQGTHGDDSVLVQTTVHEFEVTIDSSCDGRPDTVCNDICPAGDSTAAIMGNVDQVDLLGAGGPVTVTGDSTTGSIVATGGALGADSSIEVPDGLSIADLGLAVAGVPFKGRGGNETQELAVGGSNGVLLYFRTGLTAGTHFDCDPRSGAPADVACQ